MPTCGVILPWEPIFWIAESHGRFMVLDADDAPGGRRLQALAQVLEQLGCPSYLEASRRGGHLWFFFDEPLPGKEIRRFGKGLLAYFNLPDMELYPKQDKLGDRPGIPDSLALWRAPQERPALWFLHPGWRAVGADLARAAAGAGSA